MAIKNHQYGNLRYTLPRAQTGAVLLAYILVFIVASSFYLTKKLNTNLSKTQHSVETGIAMMAARNALIGYAISYPDKINANEGPGYLPCPDLINNGSAGGSCSLNGITSIGRFPYKTLEAEELRDGHGERLWYVVSDNFRNNPKMIPLNTETAGNSSGDMTVDGYANIAAVIFSAGAPENNQNRISANENDYTHYIEATFTDSDGDAVIDSITTADTDRYILLTKDELMQAVEKRVIGEVSHFLTTYFNDQAAYPWLTIFADPKTNEKRLIGEHTGSDNQADLADSSADFTQWGVVNGDVVWNITDGSYGLVTAVGQNQLTIGAGMSLGSENDFDTDDEYYVYVSTYATPFIGTATATAGSSNLDLVDSTKDFDALGVQIGDILENVTDGSSGVIESVATTQLSVSSLSGGTNDVFTSADVYRIRTSIGRVTASGSLTLNDTNVDFTVMGIQVGDLVRNISDGSFGRITSVATNQLTVAELILGEENDFDIGDYYALPRFNEATNTREGLLSFHEPGEVFHTSFSIDWGAQEAEGSDVVHTSKTDEKSEYASDSSGIEEWVERSRSNNSGTISVSEADSQCTWINSTIAECTGTYTDTAFLSGTATSTSVLPVNEPASGNEYFYDTSQDFDDAGVYEGDKVENLTNGTKGLVDYADSTGVHFMSIDGEIAFSISTGDSYRISVATKRLDYIADAATDHGIDRVYESELSTGITLFWNYISNSTTGSAGLVLVDSSADFIAQGLEAGKLVYNATDVSYFTIVSVDSSTQLTTNLLIMGTTGLFSVGDIYGTLDVTSSKLIINDSVVEVNNGSNRDDGQGLITAFGYNNLLGGYWFEYTALKGGNHADIHASDNYRILYDYVDRREYDFRVRINSSSSVDGGFNVFPTSGVRQRNVCLGYGSDCTGTGTDTTIPGDGGTATAMVTIRDYDNTGELVGDATVTVPSAGAQGRVKVSGINLLLSENYGDIPPWFLKNKWHQLIYVAYSAGDSPNGGAVCTVGTNCLTLNGGGSPDNNKRALVISAGEPLATQDRTSGNMTNYYESGNNNSGDDGFQIGEVLATFNDQVRVLATSP